MLVKPNNLTHQPRIVYQTPSQPRQVRLDTSTACNAKCLSCHRFTCKSRPDGIMTMSMLQDILNHIATWPRPLDEIVPVNYGDLFCNRNWRNILTRIHTTLPKTRIVIPTNGSRLQESDLLTLYKIPTISHINFSVNAYFPETYEAFMGLPASNIYHIEIIANMIKLHIPCQLWFSMVYDPSYQTELEKDLFIQHWNQYGTAQIIPASNCGRYSLAIPNYQPCRSIFSDLVIGHDGKLSSCCFDAGFELDLGHISNNNVLGAWDSPGLVQLRKLHNEGRRQEYHVCKDCSFA